MTLEDPTSKHISALIHSLASQYNDTQLRAENELIGIGEPAVESLIEATKSTNPQVRWRAAFCLGEIGDERGYPVVLALLEDLDYYARAEAVDAVAKLGGSRAITPLADVVRKADEHQHGADHAAWALAAMGSPAVPVLIDIVGTGSTTARSAALGALAEAGDERAIAPIAELLGDAELGLEAASAIATLGDARGVDDLISYLRSSTGESDEHYGYCHSLAKLGSPCVGPLLQVAASATTFARREALHLLGEIGDPAALDGLAALEVDAALALDVLAARGECGDLSVLPSLIEALEGDLSWSGGAYHRISEALGRLGEAAVEPLARIVRDGSKAAREEAADALGETCCESAIEPLAELLHDEDAEIRTSAVGSLGEIGVAKCSALGERCLSLIEPLSSDVDRAVRNEVACYTDHIRSEMKDQSLVRDNDTE